MRVLTLDLSSKTGWATFDAAQQNPEKAGFCTLLERGLIQLESSILELGPYPWCYLKAAQIQATRIVDLIERTRPQIIVVEETNLGKNRYSQKFLEFLHSKFLDSVKKSDLEIVYLSSSAWRSALGLQMSSEDKKNNRKLSKAKNFASHTGQKLDKKILGVKGKINKKHLAIRYVNATFNLNLKMKDNDIADAICLGAAWAAGADVCDGT